MIYNVLIYDAPSVFYIDGVEGNVIRIDGVSQEELECLTCILRAHDTHFCALPYIEGSEEDSEE